MRHRRVLSGVVAARLGRVAAAVTVAGVLVGAVGVTPAAVSPAQASQQARDAVLAQILRAAEPTPDSTSPGAPAPSGTPAATPTPPPAPAHKRVASGRWVRGSKFRIAADALGADASFSGYKVSTDLDVTVDQLPSLAKTPGLPGTAVGDPFQITATDSAGRTVTAFPAQATNLTPATKTTPARADVTPGVRLTVNVSGAAAKSAGVDTRTLKLYTRESDADPWTLLPSYYDKTSGQVVAESTHLSQFVVIGTPWVAPPRPRVVLDPDQNIGNTTSPANVSEGPYNVALAQGVAADLQRYCLADVALTGTDPNSLVSDQVRAGIAANFAPTVTVTLAFNTLVGHAWGLPTDTSTGGTQLFTRQYPRDQALEDSFHNTLPVYTGRPSHEMGPVAWPPGPAFNNVPGAYTHAEVLFLDNNNDWPVINTGFSHIVDGTFTSIGKYLASLGFDCTNPATGGWPDPPTAAELAKWKRLGHQNFETYGAEPISFSTGNLVEDEPTFSLTGPGGQSVEGMLTYNSQDGRLTRTGAGWSFGLGAHLQRFTDGSVLVVRGDGASTDFTPNGAGGYTPGTGVNQTLTDIGSGNLKLVDPTGQAWVFDAAGIEGIGNLTSYTDRAGHTTTLSYGTPSATAQFLPLTGITDSAGQTVNVSSDTLGRITAFTLPDGRTWTLGYDGAGNLTSLTDPTGGAKTFTYDGTHQLLTATDPTGVRYLTNTYDTAGRVTRQVDGDGRVRTVDYGNGSSTYTDQNGHQTVYAFDKQSRVTSITQPGQPAHTYTYNPDNTVASSTDPAGHTWAYSYDGSGNVTKQTLPDGTTVAYTYSSRGDLTSITDAGGPGGSARTTRFTLDGRGNTTGITQADGSVLHQVFDQAGNLTKTSQPSGAATTFTYDTHGNVSSQTDADGVTTQYSYDSSNRLVAVTDGNGNTTRITWTGADRIASSTNPAGGTTTYTYNGNGNLTAATDPTGATTTYQWDHDWNLTATTNPLGAVTTTGYDPEDTPTSTTDGNGAATKFVLDQLGQPTTTIDPNGGTWGTGYDLSGNVVTATNPKGATTRYSYDALNRLTKRVTPGKAATAYDYDTVGRLTRVTDPNGRVTTYGHDLLDRVTRVTDPAGNSIRYRYDIDGNQVGVIDRQGNPTATAYTPAGRVKTVTGPTGAKTSYSYDAAGNVVSITDPNRHTTTVAYTPNNQVATVTDPDKHVTRYGYDADGRTTSVTDANGNTTRTGYDAGGQVVSTTNANGATTRYGYDRAGHQTSVTDPDGNPTAYRYDKAGQLVAVLQNATSGPASSTQNVTTRYGYDSTGNVTRITDPNGNTDRFSYNPAGQLTAETNPAGHRWSYSYDPAGQLVKQVTPTGTISNAYTATGDLASQVAGGQTTSYRYDNNRNLIATENPAGTTGYEYDPAGNLTKQLSTTGQAISYGYDKAGQLSTLTLPSTTGTGTQKVAYTYDPAGNMTKQASPWGDLNYTWDPAGNLTRTARTGGLTTDYSYDPAGQVTSILTRTLGAAKSAPGAATNSSSSSAPGQVSTFVTLQDLIACATKNGNAAAAALAGGCEKTPDYLARRTTPTEPDPIATGDGLQNTYTYDPAGNVTAATRAIGAPTTTGVLAGSSGGGEADRHTPVGAASTSLVALASAGSSSPAPVAGVQTSVYNYDPLNRLTGSTSTTGSSNAYTYDAASNRITATQTVKGAVTKTTATYNTLNQVTGTTTTGPGAGSASYRYDASGNRTGQTVAGTTTGFSYSPLGQLTGVTTPGRSSSYAYDGVGSRVTATDSTSHGSVTTSTLFSGSTPVQQNNSVAGITSLLYNPNGGLALQSTSSGGTGTGQSTTTWDILDRLGSTIAQAQGAHITQLAQYDDWGTPTFETDGYNAPAGYTGQQQDPGYNLDLFNARAYDPTTGTWNSADTFRGLLTVPQSLNRYGYVAENPTTLIDYGGNSWLGDIYNTAVKAVKTVVKAVTTVVKAAVTAVKNVVNTVSHGVAAAATTIGAVASRVGSAAARVYTAVSSATGRPVNSGGHGASISSGYRAVTNCPQTFSLATWKQIHPFAVAQTANALPSTKMFNGANATAAKAETCGSTNPTRDCAPSTGSQLPQYCPGLNLTSCRDALSNEDTLHTATKSSGSVTQTYCVVICLVLSSDDSGRANGIGFGIGPRIGGEVDLGRTWADEPGFSGNVSGSLALGGGVGGSVGIQDDYSGRAN